MSNYGLEDNKTFYSVNKNAMGAGERFTDDLHPHVRYADDKDGRPDQHGTLRSIHEPIPDGAAYFSPVYYIREDEEGRLESNPGGWYGNGECIATDLQNECEADDRVLYPILIESDKGESWGEQIGWEREFIEEHLPVSPYDCRWYYSGSRSVHCHTPLLTTGEGIEYLREVAGESHDGLDEAIYSCKRQFRIPGVEHDKTGYPKVRIEPEWDDAEIGRAAVTGKPERPETMADLLRETFGPDVLENPEQFVWEPDTGTKVTIKSEAHPWEPGTEEPDGVTPEKWQAYNRHAFSPYALAGNGLRSMALVSPIGGAYRYDGRTHLPSRIWMAVTCAGETWHNDGHCPVYLSKPDYSKARKLAVEPGDDLFVIGGGNGESRIFRVDGHQYHEIWYALDREVDPGKPETRADTLDVIESLGLDPGRPGRNGSSRPARESEKNEESSRAMTLQMQAERWGIDSLTHQERLHLGNRLLRMRGWEGAIGWYREQFGDEFDRDLTVKHLKGIASKYDDLPDV